MVGERGWGQTDRGFTSTMSKRAGEKITPKTFLCMRVSHLSLHRESPAFSGVKSWLCAPPQSTHSSYYQFIDVLHQCSHPAAPVINHPLHLKTSPETRICCSRAASCAFNQKMQLTEPILHSPFTPLHSTPLHLLSLHSLRPSLPASAQAVIRMQGLSGGPHTE